MRVFVSIYPLSSVSLSVMDFYCIPVWWLCSWPLIAKCHFVLPSVCFRLFGPLSDAELERKALRKEREGETERVRERDGPCSWRESFIRKQRIESPWVVFFVSPCLLNIDELSWIKDTHKKRSQSCKMIYFTGWLEWICADFWIWLILFYPSSASMLMNFSAIWKYLDQFHTT